MKKMISLLLLFAVSLTVFSQQNIPGINTDYLKKSKKQKKIALILLGGGATFFLTGVVIPKGELVHSGFLGNDYENDGIKSAFKLTGMLSMLGSIPLFIASSKNKKRAASLGFRMEKTPSLQQQNFVHHSYPALTLNLSLQ